METPRVLASIPTHAALDRPSARALLHRDRETTWRELDERSNQIARGLQEEGCVRGSRVGILTKNQDRYFDVLYGTAKARGVLVPANWRLAPAELRFIFSDAEIRVLFVSRDFLTVVDGLRERLPRLERIVCLDDDAGEDLVSLADWRAPWSREEIATDAAEDDVVVQLYTSGTTGHPKGAEIQNHYLFRALAMAQSQKDDIYTWNPDEVALVQMPLFHIGGLMFAFAGHAQGCPLLLVEEFSPGEILKLVDEFPIPVVPAVPTMVQALVDHPDAATTDTRDLRYILYGAAPMPSALLRKAMATIGCRFAQFYGMTESTMVTCLPPEDHDPEGNERMSSVGRPLPGVTLRIVDRDGEELPLGEIGEIAIQTPVLMKGYWKNPEATAGVHRGGWFHTGDAGYLDSDGYLYLKDRVKDTIISGGENIYPAEVENALYGHPTIREVAVVGIPDSQWGEVPKAFVVLNDGSDLDEEGLRAYAAERIARYKLPKSFEVVRELPRTASGKVLRRELRPTS